MEVAPAVTHPFGPDQFVYDSLLRAILDHRLPPGTKLTEEKLSALFGVSRERVRKVILRLAHDKCVDLVPNRGAFVAQPTEQESRDVFEARRTIEDKILELALQRAKPDDFARLEANLASEREEHQHGQFKEAVFTSGDFHLLLADIAGNQVLTDMLKDLVARSSLILSMYGQKRFSVCGLDEHSEIVRRLKEGQMSKARRLLQEHLQKIEQQLAFDLGKPRVVDLAQIFSEL